MILHAAGFSAYAGVPPAPACGLAVAAVLYIRGVRATRDRTRPVAFVAGWFVLGIALASPLHAAGERLLSMHMVQHVLVMAVAAPLLVWSTPVATLLRGMPHPARARAASVIRVVAPMRRRASTIATACVLQTVVLWGWHVPTLYQASVRHSWVHALQHSSLLIVALLFWMSLPLRREDRGRNLAAIASLFITTLQMGVLAALFTFARMPWYPVYATHGVSAAVADQQLAGVIMWVPGAFPYIGAALAFVWRLLRRRQWQPPLILNQPLLRVVMLCALLPALLSITACNEPAYDEGSAIAHGDAHRGPGLLKGYGCTACHTIPGVPGSRATVGPNLGALRSQMYIAGVMPNSPDNLQRWIQNPKAVDSLTAMPVLGVSAPDARDIASYLYSLK